MTYAVILQYPKDGQLEENRVMFFGSLAEAEAWRAKQNDSWLKVFRVEPVSDRSCPSCAPGYDCERGIYAPGGAQ